MLRGESELCNTSDQMLGNYQPHRHVTDGNGDVPKCIV